MTLSTDLTAFLRRHPHVVATRVDLGPECFRQAGLPLPKDSLQFDNINRGAFSSVLDFLTVDEALEIEGLVVWSFAHQHEAEKFARIFDKCVVPLSTD